MNPIKTIKRKKSSTLLAGVCGSIADYFEIKTSYVRGIYLFLTIVTAFIPGFLFYMVLMLLIPREQVDVE